MNALGAILENVTIDGWAKHFARSPHQANQLHESDAELLPLPGDPERCLAITIDTVAEEIAAGLYRDPFTMGWVTVMACLSDLAAVGADPLGVVISVGVEPDRPTAFTDRIAEGMQAACAALGVFILGGDTNATSSLSLTACGVGLVPRRTLLTRRGCRPGDAVFVTKGLGAGNALGLVRLAGLPDALFPEELYRPVAALKAGRLARGFASCAMDTSDGLLTTLDQLLRLNGVGFEVDCRWEAVLAPEVEALCTRTGTPPWLMLAGPHGEFVLVLTIPEERVDGFHRQARREGVEPIRLGTVQEEAALSLRPPDGRRVEVDMAPVRNLAHHAAADPERYLREFRAFGRQWRPE